MAALDQFLRLTPFGRRLFIKAWFLLSTIRLMLWLLPFQSTMRFLTRFSQKTPAPRLPDCNAASQVGLAVARASRFVPQATCLPQALAAQVLLKRLGFPAELRIGVAKNGARELQGHAWVENQGRIMVGEEGAEIYFPLPALQ
jgi:hypothetical protein